MLLWYDTERVGWGGHAGQYSSPEYPWNIFRIEKSTAFLERANIISHSNNTFLDLREEDNLSIVDKMAGPNVSFIQGVHCT